MYTAHGHQATFLPEQKCYFVTTQRIVTPFSIHFKYSWAMTNLHGLYFDEYALNFLTQFILILGMLFYFLRTKRHARQLWSVFFAFTGLAIFTGGELIIATAVWSRQFYALYLHYMGMFLAMLAGLSFSYTFAVMDDDPFARQRKRELPIGLISFGIGFLFTIGFGFYQWSQLKPGGNPNLNLRLLDVVIALLMLVIITVYLRRMWGLAHQSSPHRWGWHHLAPDKRAAGRVLYELTALVFLLVLFTSMMALTSLGILPDWLRAVIPTLGMLLVLCFLSIAYLHATLERTTFMVRIVGTTLLLVFMVLGTIGMIVASTYSDYIQVRPPSIPAQTITFDPQSDGFYTATTASAQFAPIAGRPQTAPVVSLPFDFSFAGQRWSQIDLSQPGVIAFGGWSEALYDYNYLPAISFAQLDMENAIATAADDSIAISWGGEASVQVVLWKNGRFQLTTPAMSGDSLQRIGFQSGTGSTDFTPFDPTIIYDNTPITADGLLTDYDILFHQALHPLMAPLVALVLLVSLLSIIGLPILFQAIIINPLQALVQGVEQVEAGDLDVEVPIANEDEIGQVTRTFNRMVAAVRDVELTLETEVVKRTHELAESQRQLGAIEERERIGREIHDDLGQIMGYIQLQGEAASARLRQNEPEQVQTILTEMTTVAHEAHDRVRQYILGIRTGQTEQPVDFWTALDAFLALAQERYDLIIELTADPNLRADWRLTPAVETQLLRIVQEGITNVYKHAHATLVQIIITSDDDWLTLILKDNGDGFDVPEKTAVSDEHFGLKIMQERAESVNGRLQISSTPKQGTQLHLQLPCARKAMADGATYTWRIMLVDDHELFREGLGNMLRPHGLQIVGTAASGREAESKVATLQPDLILMDIHMPKQDGLETTRRLKKQFPQLKIVMLTMAEDEALLLQALKYGASGYLLKNLPAPQFLSLLNEVMAGKTIIAPSLATKALTALAQQDDGMAAETAVGSTAVNPLTNRQKQVLSCLAEGMSNKQIGEQLHISENTVKYHVRQMMDRLQLETRHELIRYHLDG